MFVSRLNGGMVSVEAQKQKQNITKSCPRGRRRLGEFTNKRNRAKDQHTGRTGPMNFDDVTVNNNNTMYHHVLEVALDKRSLLV
jgi:hypothetical protein